MTKEFKELPELGEYIQYVGDGAGFFNKGTTYEIIQLDTLEVIVIDDSKDMHHLTLEYLNDNFVAKTKQQADVHDLLANLGRRLHEVEEAIAPKDCDLSASYPEYFKDVSDIDSIDVYKTHELFGIDDPSGAIQHASKKLLLSGARTGGKSKFTDIKEARDTLNRWLEIIEMGTEASE